LREQTTVARTVQNVSRSVSALETLALLLRQRIAAVPHAVIAITRDVGGGTPPPGWFAPPARFDYFFGEPVDIGAGLPDP
jgi:hypothetical protein